MEYDGKRKKIHRNDGETYYVSSVDFELDGIIYNLMGFDLDMTADELFEMAEEIIASK